MIENVAKFISYLVLLVGAGGSISYAYPEEKCVVSDCYIHLAKSGQDENSFIRKNQEAVKSSTNSALFTVYRIKCLNTQGRSGLVACNKALSIKPNIPALFKRRAIISAQLKQKHQSATVVRHVAPAVRKATPQRPKSVKRTKPRVSKPTRLFYVYRFKCLNTQGKNGLAACKKALSIKPNTPALYKRRTFLSAQLQRKRKPAAVVRHVVVPAARKPVRQRPPKPKEKPIISKLAKKVKKTQTSKNTRKEKIAKKQKKEIIVDIQKLLIKLGFDLRVADGIAGKNTQKAIDKFIELSKRNMTSKINVELLTVLRTALKLQKQTDKSYDIAKKQISNEEFNEALVTIENALKLSPWNTAFTNLKSKVKTHIGSNNVEKQKKTALHTSLRNFEEEMIFKQKKIELIVSQRAEKEVEQDKELVKLETIKKAKEEERLKVQQQIHKKQEKQHQRITEIISQANIELLKNNFSASLQSINEGLLLSSNNSQLIQLKESILSAQKQYQLREKLRIIIKSASEMRDRDDHEKTILLVSEGLKIDPNNKTLLTFKKTILAKKEQVTKLVSLLSESRKHFNEGSFKEAINTSSSGLLINPNHPELLKIKQKAKDENKRIINKMSLRKQKISNYLSLIQGKQRELISIEKEIYSKRNHLLIEAQKTLKQHWIVENEQ